MTDLSGPWTLTDAQGDYRVSLTLPGDGITALYRAGEIPDPYWGRNEDGLRWICERDWVARREFDHDGSACDLVVEELDTVAELRLNGVLALSAANMFRRWRVDTTGMLRKGRNEIEITFRSPVTAAAKAQDSQPFFVPYHAGNCPIPNGNMLRKQQCDFGWDWNIALGGFGVYGAIRLEKHGPRIRDVIVSQAHAPGRVVVSVTANGDGDEVTATLCGVTASAPMKDGVGQLRLELDNPVLWWPAGLGDQVLHDLTVTMGKAKALRRIGLRDLRLVSESDQAGRSFGFVVNGHPVFARGANWIPADALAGRITPDAVRGLLQSALDAHMNMIRVWGGGRYEPDWFYDLCDEMGIMVWQDAMLSCHLYPATPDFLAEIDAELRETVARLNHHACLALWCGDNELIGALTWYPESRKDRDRYLVTYDRLNRTVETAIKSVSPDANWWPSSPSPGVLSFGDAWHDDSSGDMHFWSVWHEGRDFDHYRDIKPRFCSEFGFQSYPSMDVIRRFADPADFNIAAPVMESHQKNAGGNARIAETMFRYFRFPVDFPNFVYLSQVQQGLAIKTAVTQWRSLKPHCMGAVYWQLNDTWPTCSWSSLDHGGGWKLLHHMARQFFAPVTVVCIPDGDELVLTAVNDTRAALSLTVHANAVNMTGQSRMLGAADLTVTTDAAVPVLRMSRAALGADEILAFTWSGGAQGGDIFSPRAWKSYDLHPAGLTHQVAAAEGRFDITLSSSALAPFVAVEADVPGRFSQNAFALFPGFPARVSFVPEDPAATPRFTFRDLHSATYGPPAQS